MTRSRRKITQDELKRVGRRLREYRIAAGMSQAQLAGKRFSHAYVSVVERAKRTPSVAAIDYFANRLGVSVEAIWDEAGFAWIVETARDLAAQGRRYEGRELLSRALQTFARDSDRRPHLIVALYRELAVISDDAEAREEHLRLALEVAGDDDSLLNESARLHAYLAESMIRKQRTDEAVEHYQRAVSLFMEVTADPALFGGAGPVAPSSLG